MEVVKSWKLAKSVQKPHLLVAEKAIRHVVGESRPLIKNPSAFQH